MTRLRRSAPAAVETPSGCVTAEKVALATGAWSAQVAELRRTAFVIPAHIVATEPSPGVLDEMGWQRGRPFADGRTAVHYGQRTGDDCLVFGRGGGRLGFAGRVIPTHYHDRPNAESIVADMRELFPATRALTVQWRWGAPGRADPARLPVGGHAGEGAQHPLWRRLRRQRRRPQQPHRAHAGVGRARAGRRLRPLAARVGPPELPATRTVPLRRGARHALRHRALRGARGRGQEALPGLARAAQGPGPERAERRPGRPSAAVSRPAGGPPPPRRCRGSFPRRRRAAAAAGARPGCDGPRPAHGRRSSSRPAPATRRAHAGR